MTLPPDGLTGTILAIEGIEDAWTLLNGPLGCKYYHGHISERQLTRTGSMDPLTYREKYYFGQPRVPCTYLEEDDYIGGPSFKLKEILASLCSRVDGPIVVVNSPGASLIGEDIENLVKEVGGGRKCMVIEAPGSSRPASACCDDAMVAMLRWLAPRAYDKDCKKVNLLGLSLMQRYWMGTVGELSELLAMMGVHVVASVGAGSRTSQLMASSLASLNIPVCTEYCAKQSEWYTKEYGIPCLALPEGAPVGFSATEKMVEGVARSLHCDPSMAMQRARSARSAAYREIARFNSLTGLPKGCSFSVSAESSIAYPLTKWLYEYLGMIPVAIEISEGSDPGYARCLEDFLGDIGARESLDNSVRQTSCDIVFGDGATTSLMEASGSCRKGIEISLPAGRRIDLLPRTIFGFSGALYLIEQILNGLWEE